MKKLFFLALMIISVQQITMAQQVSFYCIAHPDQWQLFMGEKAGEDILNARNYIDKVVFIYVTAGDATCAPNGTLNVPYYLAREEGANNSVQLIASSYMHDLPFFPTPQWDYLGTWISSMPTINGHAILRKEYKNVISYYLRLPDGCGSTGLNGESLEYLYNNWIGSISAVDNTATYFSWLDLQNTVYGIMANEVVPGYSWWLNTADPDQTVNPGDHPDHVYAGILGIDAFTLLPGNNGIALYEEYVTSSKPANISEDAIVMKGGIYGAADFGRTGNWFPSDWSPWTVSFLSKTYLRMIYQ